MLKKILVCLLLISCLLFASKNDKVWSQRQSATGAENAYSYFKEIVKEEPTFENYWRLAASAHFYGELFATNNAQEIFALGREAASSSISLNNREAIGYFLYGVNTLGWAKYLDQQQRTPYGEEIVNAMNKVIAIDPEFGDIFNRQGAAYMIRALVYSYSVAPSMSILETEFKKALEIGPNNRQIHRFYAQYLLTQNKKEEALKIINKGLAIHYNQFFAANETYEINLLKELKKKI